MSSADLQLSDMGMWTKAPRYGQPQHGSPCYSNSPRSKTCKEKMNLGILKPMHEKTMNQKLFCVNLSTTVLTAGGSATTQVVKSLGLHVPVEMSGAECTGQLLL